MSLVVLPFSKQALNQALEILKSGGVVAHATETCYGFACDLSNPEAVKRLFDLKKRPYDSPVSALFPTVAEAKKFVEWNEEAGKLAKKYLPGPLTLVLPIKNPPSFLPSPGTGEGSGVGALGIRISSHPLACELAERFGKPLSTTSANVHGEKNTYSAAEIIEQFMFQEIKPDMIIDSGKMIETPSSTVIDLTSGKGKMLRKGVVGD
ncbi:threonylcarbamoyl-AMP synthase [Candidatus Peribacteria bacterium RIFCSPLOWO2_02_FULL_51_10]|nr:MAG: threonylcarbamoyl-AMP synthase [Candidatus Peribacteria bacterium RIFCSPLOWO2_02_FULL_51_10]